MPSGGVELLVSLNGALHYCKEARYLSESNDMLEVLQSSTSAVKSLCGVANEILDDAEVSQRPLSFREELSVAVLLDAAHYLGITSIVYGYESEEAVLGPLDLDSMTWPTGLAGALARPPEDVDAIDVAINFLSEEITRIRAQSPPVDEEPDPLDIEAMRTFTKEMLEHHFWPVRPKEPETQQLPNSKPSRFRLLRRLRFPTGGEISCFGFPTLITAVLLPLLIEEISLVWLAAISVGVGSFTLYSHVYRVRESKKQEEAAFDRKREEMHVREWVVLPLLGVHDRFINAVRAGPRGFY